MLKVIAITRGTIKIIQVMITDQEITINSDSVTLTPPASFPGVYCVIITFMTTSFNLREATEGPKMFIERPGNHLLYLVSIKII